MDTNEEGVIGAGSVVIFVFIGVYSWLRVAAACGEGAFLTANGHE
jgi:hypothetical protein